MSKLIPVELKGQRVLTTKQLSEIYQCNETQIQQNFNNHNDKFLINKHYFLLQGDELREFKRNIDIIEVAPNVNKLYLWTERGANRHCKILDTDKAWEQFDNLEETYFRVKEGSVKQLSPMDQLRLQYEVIENHEDRIDVIEEKLDSLEIGSSQRKQILKARHAKVSELLGGKKSIAYENSSFRAKVYSNLGRQYNNYFDISGYELTPKNRFKEALEVINSYNLPTELAMELKKINNQITFDKEVI